MKHMPDESHPALPAFFQQFKVAAAAPTNPLYDADAEKALAEHPPTGETRAFVPFAPEAPFPVGARVRYGGTQRLFAGYQSISILEPGREYAIAATAGAYSVYVADVGGTKYEMLISAATKGDWLLISG